MAAAQPVLDEGEFGAHRGADRFGLAHAQRHGECWLMSASIAKNGDPCACRCRANSDDSVVFLPLPLLPANATLTCGCLLVRHDDHPTRAGNI